MSAKNYITALELGSSKISGAIGIKTIDGVQILAYANESVDGFIAKGVVQNIDKTSEAINSIINKLENQLNNVTVTKAYIALGGMSIRSTKSTILRDFSQYTKITKEVLEEMAVENDSTFIAPTGYQKIQVITLEFGINGDKKKNPLGMSTKHIEGNYLNIIVKEQLMKQLTDSFQQAGVEIIDSFTGIRLMANHLLNAEEKRQGCALVDLGADTTTVAVYTNDLLRRLTVLPLGSSSITKDLTSEQISPEEAEELKITRGYHWDINKPGVISPEKADEIILARMMEIIQNINYQIDSSEEKISRCVLAGGGAKLKNIETIFQENVPGLKLRKATETLFSFSTAGDLKLTSQELGSTLLGLFNEGEGNCCQEITKTQKTEEDIQPTAPNAGLFPFEEELKDDIKKTEEKREEPKVIRNNPEADTSKKRGKLKVLGNQIGDLFGGIMGGVKDFVEKATNEEDDN